MSLKTESQTKTRLNNNNNINKDDKNNNNSNSVQKRQTQYLAFWFSDNSEGSNIILLRIFTFLTILCISCNTMCMTERYWRSWRQGFTPFVSSALTGWTRQERQSRTNSLWMQMNAFECIWMQMNACKCIFENQIDVNIQGGAASTHSGPKL